MFRDSVRILTGFVFYTIAWPFIWIASKVMGQIAPGPLELSLIFCEWDFQEKEKRFYHKLQKNKLQEDPSDIEIVFPTYWLVISLMFGMAVSTLLMLKDPWVHPVIAFIVTVMITLYVSALNPEYRLQGRFE